MANLPLAYGPLGRDWYHNRDPSTALPQQHLGRAPPTPGLHSLGSPGSEISGRAQPRYYNHPSGNPGQTEHQNPLTHYGGPPPQTGHGELPRNSWSTHQESFRVYGQDLHQTQGLQLTNATHRYGVPLNNHPQTPQSFPTTVYQNPFLPIRDRIYAHNGPSVPFDRPAHRGYQPHGGYQAQAYRTQRAIPAHGQDAHQVENYGRPTTTVPIIINNIQNDSHDQNYSLGPVLTPHRALSLDYHDHTYAENNSLHQSTMTRGSRAPPQAHVSDAQPNYTSSPATLERYRNHQTISNTHPTHVKIDLSSSFVAASDPMKRQQIPAPQQTVPYMPITCRSETQTWPSDPDHSLHVATGECATQTPSEHGKKENGKVGKSFSQPAYSKDAEIIPHEAPFQYVDPSILTRKHHDTAQSIQDMRYPSTVSGMEYHQAPDESPISANITKSQFVDHDQIALENEFMEQFFDFDAASRELSTTLDSDLDEGVSSQSIGEVSNLIAHGDKPTPGSTSLSKVLPTSAKRTNPEEDYDSSAVDSSRKKVKLEVDVKVNNSHKASHRKPSQCRRKVNAVRPLLPRHKAPSQQPRTGQYDSRARETAEKDSDKTLQAPSEKAPPPVLSSPLPLPRYSKGPFSTVLNHDRPGGLYDDEDDVHGDSTAVGVVNSGSSTKEDRTFTSNYREDKDLAVKVKTQRKRLPTTKAKANQVSNAIADEVTWKKRKTI